MKHLITTYTRAILLMALMLCLPSALWAEKLAYAEYADGTLTFHYDENRTSHRITYGLPASDDDEAGWWAYYKEITKVVFDESFKDARPVNLGRWFMKESNLSEISGLEYLNTSEATDMHQMFSECSSLKTLDLSHFNTEKVTTMADMFYGCSNLTSLDLTSFSTKNVTTMSQMFYICDNLTELNLVSFDTQNVTNMAGMFGYDANLTTVKVSSRFVTDQVEESTKMFVNCYKLPGFDKDATPDKTNASLYLTLLASQPWVEYQTDTRTLTFHYDAMKDYTTATAKYDLPASGVAPEWLANQIYIKKVVFNEDFQDVRPESCVKWFFKMKSLTDITGLEYLNTSEVKDMDHMFCECGSLTSLDLSHFNTAGVTKMSSMFYSCEKLTSLNVSSFNTQKVEDMTYMFSHCKKLTELNLGSFDTQSVTNMEGMFYLGEALTHIYVSDLFVTDQVTSSENMFYYCAALPNFDKSYLDKTKAPEYLTYLPAQPWVEYQTDTKTLTFHNDNTQSAVAATGKYDLPETGNYVGWLAYNIYVTKVVFNERFKDVHPKICANWFYNMEALTDIQGTEYLCTDSVTDMNHMFYGCKGLTTLNLRTFDTKKVENMYYMFSYCNNLSTIYVSSSFVLDQVTNSYNMFYNCQKLPSFDSNYTDKTKAPQYLTYLPDQAWVEYQDATHTLTFHYDSNKDIVTATGKYDLPTTSVDPDWLSCDAHHVVFNESFKDARPKTCYYWFNNLTNLTDIQGIEYLNTSEVNDMSYMFYGCESLTTLDLSSFNTENVTTMTSMFDECNDLKKLNLSSFNTEKVTSMSDMFYDCFLLEELDLSSFNTENVTTMAKMFYECEALTTLNLSSFNTEKVTSMSDMFYDCYSLKELDLTSFNTKNVTDMSSMFDMYGAESCNLKNIYVSEGFVTDNVSKDTDMFDDCEKLPGYDDNQVGKSKAHYKEGGYLTLRRHLTVGEDRYNVDGYVSPTCYTDVTFTDGAAYSAPCAFTFDADNTASYTRTVSNHWATLCLPFAFSADDNATASFYSVKSYTEGNIAVNQLTGTIAAGTPVLAYVSGGELSVSATGAAAVDAPVSDDNLKGAFTQTEVGDYEYIIANDHFWNAAWLKKNNTDTKNVYVAPYRAYLTLDLSAGAKPNSISINEGETDGIDSINGAASIESLLDGAELYDLQGRRLTVPQRGMIIVRKDGVSRKVVVRP